MAPEIQPSSSSQNSSDHRGLLRILISVFSGVLFGMVLSKLKTPPQKAINSISPNTKTDEKNASGKEFSSFPPNVPPSPSESQNPCKCCRPKTPGWKIALKIGTLLAAVGAFVATGIYAWITYRMWHEMIRQNQIASKTQWLDQRAWLTLTAAETPILTINQPATLKSRLENTGKTPAQIAGGHVCFNVFRDDERDNLLHPRTERMCAKIMGGILNGGAHITVNGPTAVYPDSGQQVKVTSDLIKNLSEGKIYMMMHAKIKFTDYRNVEHWMQFCSIVFGRAPSDYTACNEYSQIDHNEP